MSIMSHGLKRCCKASWPILVAALIFVALVAITIFATPSWLWEKSSDPVALQQQVGSKANLADTSTPIGVVNAGADILNKLVLSAEAMLAGRIEALSLDEFLSGIRQLYSLPNFQEILKQKQHKKLVALMTSVVGTNVAIFHRLTTVADKLPVIWTTADLGKWTAFENEFGRAEQLSKILDEIAKTMGLDVRPADTIMAIYDTCLLKAMYAFPGVSDLNVNVKDQIFQITKWIKAAQSTFSNEAIVQYLVFPAYEALDAANAANDYEIKIAEAHHAMELLRSAEGTQPEKWNKTESSELDSIYEKIPQSLWEEIDLDRKMREYRAKCASAARIHDLKELIVDRITNQSIVSMFDMEKIEKVKPLDVEKLAWAPDEYKRYLDCWEAKAAEVVPYKLAQMVLNTNNAHNLEHILIMYHECVEARSKWEETFTKAVRNEAAKMILKIPIWNQGYMDDALNMGAQILIWREGDMDDDELNKGAPGLIWREGYMNEALHHVQRLIDNVDSKDLKQYKGKPRIQEMLDQIKMVDQINLSRQRTSSKSKRILKSWRRNS